MKLGLNTFCYEVAKWPVERQIESAARLGFRYVEYAAYELGNPTGWTVDRRREVVRRFKDAGLYCSQMLLTNIEHMAASDAAKRQAVTRPRRVCFRSMIWMRLRFPKMYGFIFGFHRLMWWP